MSDSDRTLLFYLIGLCILMIVCITVILASSPNVKEKPISNNNISDTKKAQIDEGVSVKEFGYVEGLGDVDILTIRGQDFLVVKRRYMEGIGVGVCPIEPKE